MWRTVLALAQITLLVTACGPARVSSTASGGPVFVRMSPTDVTTRIVGATAEQEEILRGILAGVGDRRIETIAIEEPEQGWGSQGDVALSFSPRASAAKDMRTGWEAWLIADAFAVQSHERGLPSVAYVATPGEASVIGDPTFDVAGRGTRAKLEAFIERVRSAAKSSGADVHEIEVLQPRDFAVAVTLRVSEPAGFLDRKAPTLFEHLGDPPGDFDLRFVDEKGRRVSENWNAGSTGAVWIRHDLEGCSPYMVSQPILYKPPPCPDSAHAVSTRIEPSDVRTKIVDATTKQETILREILAGLGRDTRIRSVHVRPAGKHWGSDSGSVAVDPHVSARENVRTEWEIWLLANAFADRSRQLHLQRVTALFVNGQGESSLDSGEPVEPRDPITTEILSDEVVSAAAKSGAQLLDLELLHPNNPAVVVKLQVDDPASFLARRAQRFYSAVRTPDVAHYDGLLVEIVDANGQLAWSHSHAVSEDAGEMLWGYTRPDLAGCDQISRLGGAPNKPPPPPCPAK